LLSNRKVCVSVAKLVAGVMAEAVVM
jgi:hypothetical protein